MTVDPPQEEEATEGGENHSDGDDEELAFIDE